MEVIANKKYFREGTKLLRTSINFVFTNGGIGDYINWLPAMMWIAKENPHVQAKLIVPDYFYPVARFFLKEFDIKVFRVSEVKRIIKKGELVCSPHDFKPYINATGTHLLDLGFMYYAALSKAVPGYDTLPLAKFASEEIVNLTVSLKNKTNGKYAVFTPGATADARAMPAVHFNELVSFTAALGITPVFLGAKNFTQKVGAQYVANFNDGYDYSKGIDLREQTSLLEAIQIMENSKFVTGLDNGLLHLASCTNAPVIFGYNITTQEHREPRRPTDAKLINITLSEKTLSCIGCQSNMRFLKGHSFKKCLYGDYACTDLLFKGDTWKNAIEMSLT